MTMRTPPISPRMKRRSRRVTASPAVPVALGVAALCIVLTFLHAPFVNGPAWWKWYWHDPGVGETVQAVAMLLLPLALVLYATRDAGGRPPRYGRRLAVLVGAALVLQAMALPLQRDVPLPSTLAGRIKSVHHGHFVAAERLTATGDGWLARFHELSAGLTVHPRVHPPGPALLHAGVIAAVGDRDAAAVVSALLLGLVAAAIPPGTYALARSLGMRRRASLAGAAIMTLAPAVTLFFPSFDVVYAAWTTPMLACWAWGLRRDRVAWAVLFGVMLAVASFFQYRLLVLGALVVSLAVLRYGFARRPVVFLLAKHVAIAGATTAAAYLGFWLVTGFRPDLTFLQALRNQEDNLSILGRHLPQTIPWDLWDFALGLGWLPALLAVGELARRLATRPRREATWVLAVLLLQPVIVACTGLIQAENARCWMFLMPLVAIAAGPAVARQRAPVRGVIYAVQTLTIAALGLNLWLR